MSTADAWIAALSGLGGAIIGALASVGAVVWLDKSKEKRAAARAKRLIAGELLQAHTVLESLILFGPFRAPVDMAQMLPMSAWQEFGAHLEGVTDDVRDEAVGVYTTILVTRASLAGLMTQETNGVLPSNTIESLTRTDDRIVKLRAALTVRDPQGTGAA